MHYETPFLTLKFSKAIKICKVSTVKFPYMRGTYRRTLIPEPPEIMPKSPLALSPVKSSQKTGTIYYLFFFGLPGHGIQWNQQELVCDEEQF